MVHVLEANSESSESRLSPEEAEYAREYAESMDSHFTSLLLQHMPANFQSTDRKKTGETDRMYGPLVQGVMLTTLGLVSKVTLINLVCMNAISCAAYGME